MKLSKVAIQGIKWSSISQIGRQVISYVTVLILVVLISPEDFGLIAMAMVVIGFLEIFKDMGTSAAIIHLDEINEVLLSSMFWINMLFGITTTLIIFFTSSTVAHLFGSEQLTDILKVLSIAFFISSFSIVQKSFLERNLKFNLLAGIELITVFIGSLVAIFLALQGFGVWSLVFQNLTVVSLTSVLLWYFSQIKFKFVFEFTGIQKVIKYSSNLVGYNILNFLIRNADYIIIGRFLGDNALGHYYIAYKIMLYPVRNISVVVSRVMFPLYSKIKYDIQRFGKVYIRVARSVALITFPLMIFLFSTSDLLSHIFLSKNWDESLLSQLLLILAPVGMIQSIASTTGSLYQASGRTEWMFRWGLISSIVVITGFIIGVQYGILGVATSYLMTTILLVYPVFAIPFKTVSLNFFEFIDNLKVIFFINLFLAIILIFLKLIIIDFMNPVLAFIILIVFLGVSYIGLLFILRSKFEYEIQTLFEGK